MLRIDRESGKSFEFWTDAAPDIEIRDGVCRCTIECGPNTVVLRCRTETLFAALANAAGAIADMPPVLDNVVAMRQPEHVFIPQFRE